MNTDGHSRVCVAYTFLLSIKEVEKVMCWKTPLIRTVLKTATG